MKKILFVMADYPGRKQEIFDKYLSPRTQQYCDYHKFEYRVYKKIDTGRKNLIWNKLFIARDIVRNELEEGDVLTVLDADMVMVKGGIPYETNKSFSYAIDNGNTHCMGNYTFRINDWSWSLIEKLTDEAFFQKFKENPSWQEWAEQAAWYHLAGIPRHSWIPYITMPHSGWHQVDYGWDRIPLEELYDHVEIRGPEGNTTLLEEEQGDPVSISLQKYNIFKSKKEDTIIRHWGGGQPWNYQEYCAKGLDF